MWGAIIGDLAGSIYEYDQYQKVSKVKVEKIIPPMAFYSDDTILTIAVLDAIINKKDYGQNLREYGRNYLNYKPDFQPYFERPFSPGFIKSLSTNSNVASKGNGAMMCISPVGYMLDSEENIKKTACLVTSATHNTEEAINCATIVSLIIFYARSGLTKEEIIKKLNLDITYEEFTKFNMTCYETIGNCLYAVFTSDSFEESIKKVISYGGDTDTNACIVGSMAEALYGIDPTLIKKAKDKLPTEFVTILELAYKQIQERQKRIIK